MLITTGRNFADSIEKAARRLIEEQSLRRIAVTVRHPGTGEIVQLTLEAKPAATPPVAGYALISQPLTIGARVIGHIELHAGAGLLRPSELMTLANRFSDGIETSIGGELPTAIAA